MDTVYQNREMFKKDRKELQQTMGKELSEMKDYMGRELACFKVELQQRDRQIEILTTQMRCLSIPANAPNTQGHLQHTSGIHQIITPQQQPKGSKNTCNPQKPLRKTLQLQPQLRNSQWKQRLTLPSSWTPMGSSYKKKKCFQAVKQPNSGAQKQVITPALAHPHISSYTQAPTTWEGNRKELGSWSAE